MMCHFEVCYLLTRQTTVGVVERREKRVQAPTARSVGVRRSDVRRERGRGREGAREAGRRDFECYGDLTVTL